MANKIFIAATALVLGTAAASAADLPSKVVAPVIAPAPYSWTGVEFGLTTNLSFSDNERMVITGNSPAAQAGLNAVGLGTVGLNRTGTDYVGAGIGANYQLTPGSGFVIGVQGDASYFDLSKNAVLVDGVGDSAVFHRRLGYLATINGRVGYAFDRVFLYGTGGFAFGGTHYGSSLFPGGAFLYSGTFNGTNTGYDFGAGIEYAIPPDSILNNLSVEKLLGFDKTLGLDIFEGTIRAEFIHYNLGSQNVLVSSTVGGPLSFTSRFNTDGDIIRIGLGYKFSGAPAPVVARY